MMYIALETAEVRVKEIATTVWTKFVREYYAGCSPKVLERLGNVPRIVWRKKGFGAAGSYNWDKRFGFEDHIEMNINYLSSPDAKDFVEHTVLHELAHCICYRIWRNSSHDGQFKKVCYALGDDGNRCHNYRLPENCNREQHTCACGTVHTFTPRSKKLALLGEYICGRCKRNLKYLFQK